MNDEWLERLAESHPNHARILVGLAQAVEAGDRWRSLLMGCSLGSGRGDEFSDIDAGVGFVVPCEQLEHEAQTLVGEAGDVVDALAHRFDGWLDNSLRLAVEYRNGVQLDLAVFPSPWQRSRPTEVAIVDKDGDLAELVPPPHDLVTNALKRHVREWTMLGWWAVSDMAKYLQRGSLFEATQRIDTVREQALRLVAAGIGIPDAVYGLTSLLDFPPYRVPDDLAATYCVPSDRAAVIRAAVAVSELLADAVSMAQASVGVDLTTPWSDISRARLTAALRPERS